MAGIQRPIVVGLQNDQRDQHVLAMAAQLVETFDCPVHLVHGFESEVHHYTTVGVGTDLANLIGVMDDYKVHELKKTIKAHAEALGEKASYRVLAGPAHQNLIAEAISKNAWMILVGARAGGHRLKWQSLSVPLALFNNSPVPVMVANDNCDRAWGKREVLKVICAEDLSHKGNGPSRFAAQFVGWAAKKARLDLFHINPLTEEALKAGIESALAASYSQMTGPLDPAAIYSNLIETIEKSLHDQIPDDLREKIDWQAHVIPGVPERELTEVIRREHPQVCIFGRHKTIHRKPFYFGKLSFATAFELDLPFVIVP